MFNVLFSALYKIIYFWIKEKDCENNSESFTKEVIFKEIFKNNINWTLDSVSNITKKCEIPIKQHSVTIATLQGSTKGFIFM